MPINTKNTDDRPAETIPERYAKDFKDASGWHNGSYIQQLHRELGRAETRIEVLEAALQFAVNFFTVNSMTNELKQIETILQSK